MCTLSFFPSKTDRNWWENLTIAKTDSDECMQKKGLNFETWRTAQKIDHTGLFTRNRSSHLNLVLSHLQSIDKITDK